MRVTIRSRGGFAGVDETLADIETHRLPAAERTAVEAQVTRLGFFSLPRAGEDEPVGSDGLFTEVTIEDGPSIHTVLYSDANVPSSKRLRNFVAHLVLHHK